MGAALLRVAVVCRAIIVVIAAGEGAGDANAVGTFVARGAGRAIFAVGQVAAVLALRLGVTSIISARIFVIAVRGFASHAFAVFANIAGGAGVAVIATGLVGKLGAAGQRIASVGRAGIAVIAGAGLERFARAAGADIAAGAVVEVIASQSVERENASAQRIAAVIGARIAVAADRLGPGEAAAVLARIAVGAGVVVRAGAVYVGVDAAGYRIATVGSARIVVIARHWIAGRARPSLANVAGRAGIGVVTQRTVVVRKNAA